LGALAAGKLAGAIGARGGDWIGEAWSRAHAARTLIDEVQTAAWHLSGFAARRDIQRISRHAAQLAEQVRALEDQVEALEAALAPREVTSRPSSGRGGP
jgi:outer membrane murein-binding lipoprotein Lpp